MKPGFGGQLLIAPKCWTTGVDSHGHEWVTDRYLMGRRECFRTLPKSSWIGPGPSKSSVRKVIALARAEKVGSAFDTGIRAAHRGDQHAALLRSGSKTYTWINADIWRYWSLTGLSPTLTRAGMLCWYATIRGNPTLMAFVQSVRVERPDAVHMDGAA
jgi:hypothetical protein